MAHRNCSPRCYQMLKAYETGGTLLTLSRDFQLSVGACRRIITEHGGTIRPPGSAAGHARGRFISIDEVQALLNEGRTMAEVAGKLLVSRQYIQQLVVYGGLTLTKKWGKQHTCNEICRAISGLPDPIYVARVATALGVSISRVGCAVRAHKRQAAGKDRTIGHGVFCGARCAQILAGIQAGQTFRAIALGLGMTGTTSLRRFQRYHPEWPWPTSDWWKRPGALDARARRPITPNSFHSIRQV